MHFNGPHSKSRSLDLMILLLDPDHNHYAIQFINDNIFSILPFIKQLYDKTKGIGKVTNQKHNEKFFLKNKNQLIIQEILKELPYLKKHY